ncbi:MAG: repair protein RadC [Pseudomonadota bacterium]|jgi:DNA repair protein RadC
MPITDWPEDERPREKMAARGPQALSDAELLAILLRVGVAGKSAVDLARELIGTFGSVGALLSANPKDIAKIKGLGPAKALQFQAALELGRRALSEQLQAQPLLNSPNAVNDFLRLTYTGETTEVFMALYLDAQNRLIHAAPLFRGTLTQTSVYPREVVKAALACNAAALIVAHNHPSGAAQPSAADVALTHRLKDALALVDIRLLDHLVVAGNSVVSLAQRGEM